MAQIKFEDIQDSAIAQQGNGPRMGFFSLKNDGDEALVRIMHDSTESFEILSTHQVEINGKYRRINCCRTPREPIENCPMCATGKNAQSRFYVHLIQYSIGEGGQIVSEPKVWERPVSFATTLKNLITNYGPLSNHVFKIHRNGAARAMDTTYDIMYMPPQQYPETVYKNIKDAFDGYSALGTIVMDRSAADVVTFLQTGNFPMPVKEDVASQVPPMNTMPPQGGYIDSGVMPVNTAPPSYSYAPPIQPINYPSNPGAQQVVPNQQTTNNIERPVRYYQ